MMERSLIATLDIYVIYCDMDSYYSKYKDIQIIRYNLL